MSAHTQGRTGSMSTPGRLSRPTLRLPLDVAEADGGVGELDGPLQLLLEAGLGERVVDLARAAQPGRVAGLVPGTDVAPVLVAAGAAHCLVGGLDGGRD